MIQPIPIVHSGAKVEPWIITPEEEKFMRATDATFEWLCSQPGEFFRPYAGKWVAAGECRIVTAGETYAALMDQLEADKVDLRSVIIDYVRRPGWTIY